jgi:hypothetical protein
VVPWAEAGYAVGVSYAEAYLLKSKCVFFKNRQPKLIERFSGLCGAAGWAFTRLEVLRCF